MSKEQKEDLVFKFAMDHVRTSRLRRSPDSVTQKGLLHASTVSNRGASYPLRSRNKKSLESSPRRSRGRKLGNRSGSSGDDDESVSSSSSMGSAVLGFVKRRLPSHERLENLAV